MLMKKLQVHGLQKWVTCNWGRRCKLNKLSHAQSHRLFKLSDCDYWFDGHCNETFEHKVGCCFEKLFQVDKVIEGVFVNASELHTV